MASHPFSIKHTKVFIVLIALGIVGIGAYLEFLFGLAAFVGTINFPLVYYFPFVFPLLLLLIALFLWRKAKSSGAQKQTTDLTLAQVCAVAAVLWTILAGSVVAVAKINSEYRITQSNNRQQQAAHRNATYNAGQRRGCQSRYYHQMSSGKGLTVYLDTLRTKDIATYDTINNVLVSASKDCFSGTITAQEQQDILNAQKKHARDRLAALGYSEAELDRMEHYYDSAPR